jgi:hypothetical protein
MLILFIVITDRHAGRFNAVIDIVKYGVSLCLLSDLGSLSSNVGMSSIWLRWNATQTTRDVYAYILV